MCTTKLNHGYIEAPCKVQVTSSIKTGSADWENRLKIRVGVGGPVWSGHIDSTRVTRLLTTPPDFCMGNRLYVCPLRENFVFSTVLVPFAYL